VMFLFQALSLAGLPPLSGFWGKYAIVMVGLEKGEFALVGISIVASILTLFSMLKIWNGAFWGGNEKTQVQLQDRRWVRMSWCVAILTGVSLVIGLGAELFMQVAIEAAERALEREGYARIVFSYLGKGSDL
jgi:multicomponent Na+:H+ antiporter subunit D